MTISWYLRTIYAHVYQILGLNVVAKEGRRLPSQDIKSRTAAKNEGQEEEDDREDDKERDGREGSRRSID
jgi:hypothetical protein